MIELVLRVDSSEEKTRAESEFEAYDLQGQIKLLGRACGAPVLWEATSDIFDLGIVFAQIFPSEGIIYS